MIDDPPQLNDAPTTSTTASRRLMSAGMDGRLAILAVGQAQQKGLDLDAFVTGVERLSAGIDRHVAVAAVMKAQEKGLDVNAFATAVERRIASGLHRREAIERTLSPEKWKAEKRAARKRKRAAAQALDSPPTTGYRHESDFTPTSAWRSLAAPQMLRRLKRWRYWAETLLLGRRSPFASQPHGTGRQTGLQPSRQRRVAGMVTETLLGLVGSLVVAPVVIVLTLAILSIYALLSLAISVLIPFEAGLTALIRAIRRGRRA